MEIINDSDYFVAIFVGVNCVLLYQTERLFDTGARLELMVRGFLPTDWTVHTLTTGKLHLCSVFKKRIIIANE